VSADDLRETFSQRRDVEVALEVVAVGEVIGGGVRLELVEEPEAFLPERQRAWAVPVALGNPFLTLASEPSLS
jgi:hypothetical protein